MILPKIVSVNWDYQGNLITGQNNNLIVKVEEEVLEKAYLFDSNNIRVRSNNQEIFTKNIEDNYYSKYTIQQMDDFIMEVLGI